MRFYVAFSVVLFIVILQACLFSVKVEIEEMVYPRLQRVKNRMRADKQCKDSAESANVKLPHLIPFIVMVAIGLAFVVGFFVSLMIYMRKEG